VREAGFSIPQEFAVVGYDDIPFAKFAWPPLTTISTHAFEQGKIVGEAAIALVKGTETGRRSAIVPLELVVRESCGAKMKPMAESGSGNSKSSKAQSSTARRSGPTGHQG
jgi:DNA-binding LacI/PurR family transcriptional regulator